MKSRVSNMMRDAVTTTLLLLFRADPHLEHLVRTLVRVGRFEGRGALEPADPTSQIARRTEQPRCRDAQADALAELADDGSEALRVHTHRPASARPAAWLERI